MNATPDAVAVVLSSSQSQNQSLALPLVHGRPFLSYLLDTLDSIGVSQVILCTTEGDCTATGIFGRQYRNLTLSWRTAPPSAPLAERLRDAFALCQQRSVLTLAGWSFFDGNLGSFIRQCPKRESIAVLAATEDSRRTPRLSSAGVCWVKQASAESSCLAARLLEEGPATASPMSLCVLEGHLAELATAPEGTERILKPKSVKNKAVFFDRDGTLNIDKNYLYKVEDLEFIEGMPEFIARWRCWGYKVIVVTNQSGIARGYYSAQDMQRLHAFMNELLGKRHAHIDAFYHCPHHPDITGPCRCRKPNPGLIEKAVFDFNLDPSQCLLFGDKVSDILAGQACGIFSVKIR